MVTLQSEAFDAHVRRLSQQSVDKHFDAFGDVPWDDPAYALDVTDPRCRTFAFDALAESAWYQSQPVEVQARVGLHRIAYCMKVGWQFENLLQRGLLSYAFRLQNGSPEFRYLHHEVVEEANHSMMFQELVDRSGLDVRGMPRLLRFLATAALPPINRGLPTLYFFFVLGGEDPIDHMQRKQLRGEEGTHPLVERIMRIHVTEEARHISFARQLLRTRVPGLGRARRHTLAVALPLLLGIMVPLMVDPPNELQRSDVPREVLRAARRSRAHAELRQESVAKLRRFAGELGLHTPLARLAWRTVGLWA